MAKTSSSSTGDKSSALSQFAYDVMAIEQHLQHLRDIAYAASTRNKINAKNSLKYVSDAFKQFDKQYLKFREVIRTSILSSIAPQKQYSEAEVEELTKEAYEAGKADGKIETSIEEHDKGWFDGLDEGEKRGFERGRDDMMDEVKLWHPELVFPMYECTLRTGSAAIHYDDEAAAMSGAAWW